MNGNYDPDLERLPHCPLVHFNGTHIRLRACKFSLHLSMSISYPHSFFLNLIYHGTFSREQRRQIYSRIRVRAGRVKKLLSRGKNKGKGRGLSIHLSICPSSCQRVSKSDCCPTSFARPDTLPLSVERVSILTAMRNICLSGVVTFGWGRGRPRLDRRGRR